MSDTAAAQLRRILNVIPQLADDGDHSIADVAARSGVDPDVLRHDLWSLMTRFDEPAGFVQGVQLYLEADRIELISNHFRRPMRLTVPELCALELGLTMLRAERPPDEYAAIDRACDRLRGVMLKLPADPLHEVPRHAALAPESYATTLATIRAALHEHHKLRLWYRRGDSSDSSERIVCPYALVVASGMYYLVAHCESSESLRIFRLDRVTALEPVDATFSIPEGFSLDGVVRHGRVFHAPAPETMTVRYSPRIARWIVEREGGALAADGSLTMSHPLADAEWGIRHVLQYGPDAEVLSPPELRRAVMERLRTMATDRLGADRG